MPISSLSDRPTPRSELRVTILEKNEIVGGRCGSFNVTVKGHGRFRHERGPSLLLLPDVYRELFEFCGSSAEACGLEVRPCIPAYQVVFDDGQRLNLGYQRRQQDPLSEPEIESRRALDAIESDGATKWDEYLRACEAFLDCGLPNFIEQRLDLATFPAFLAEALRNGARAWPLRPHSSMLSHFFSSIKLRALASFQDLYVGLEPYTNQALPAGGILTSTAPAVFGLLAAIELHPTNARCGVYAPVGGFRAVANSMETLARNLSVSVECGTTVTKITNKGVYAIDTKKAENDTGSKAAAQFVPADLIVCNADLPYVQESLLKESIDPHRIVYDWSTGGSHGRPRYRFSSGVIAFHWAIDRELTDLNTHNVFLVASSSEQAEQSWKVLRDHDDLLHNAPPVSLAEPFNFYVHRASKTDQTAAPKVRGSISALLRYLHTVCCKAKLGLLHTSCP
jgi:phytoene desaturase (3,4-didehydrolycopene-forming)